MDTRGTIYQFRPDDNDKGEINEELKRMYFISDSFGGMEAYEYYRFLKEGERLSAVSASPQIISRDREMS